MFLYNSIVFLLVQTIDLVFSFLVNYHIYTFIFFLVLFFSFSFIFLFKYAYFTLYSYIYIYWFVYINIFQLNVLFCMYMGLYFYNVIIIKMFSKLGFVILDVRSFFFDFLFYTSGFVGFLTKPRLFLDRVLVLLTQLNDRRKYILKKYVYTINHKRIAINYFILSFWTGMSGAALATMIRLEMAFPGSPFFKGDSCRYLQVATAHGLIMVFFVVVPVLFGGFANFLIPYHVGSKDVAYPRLNSIGFWIQPFAFLLVAKTAILRPQFWKYYDKTASYYPILDKNHKRDLLSDYSDSIMQFETFKNQNMNDTTIPFKTKIPTVGNYTATTPGSFKTFFWNNVVNYPESFWYTVDRLSNQRRKKVYVTKCSDRTATTAG